MGRPSHAVAAAVAAAVTTAAVPSATTSAAAAAPAARVATKVVNASRLEHSIRDGSQGLSELGLPCFRFRGPQVVALTKRRAGNAEPALHVTAANTSEKDEEFYGRAYIRTPEVGDDPEMKIGAADDSKDGGYD